MTDTTASDNYRGVWDTRIGFGKQPALLMVDFLKAYVLEDAPLYAPGAVKALPFAETLLATARKLRIPVVHTTICFHQADCSDGGMWVKKAPVMKDMVDGNERAEFCDALTPLESELVVTKQYASAFFGTSLASTLRAIGVDTLILSGCSTSGCIRATAVDGVQHGFRVMVVRDAVGDRHEGPHEANLFDIDAKYGDVISIDAATAHLERQSHAPQT